MITNTLFRLIPARKGLSFALYSANMNYSTSQYLAMTAVISVFVTILLGIGYFALFFIIDFSMIYALLLTIITFFGIVLFIFYYPTSIANKRAKEIDKELPFALRHMATELRAGVGLYRVLRTIAVADYGILSEELARTIAEIEEGSDTKEALKNLSLRSKSYSLKNTITHILRAIKSGGNLSEVMNNIAEDVSFQIKLDIETFAEKMNFFGVIYIFMIIVLPVMVAILGGIRNAPVGGNMSFFSSLPLTPLIILIFFAVFLPMIMFILVIYVKSVRPSM